MKKRVYLSFDEVTAIRRSMSDHEWLACQKAALAVGVDSAIAVHNGTTILSANRRL